MFPQTQTFSGSLSRNAASREGCQRPSGGRAVLQLVELRIQSQLGTRLLGPIPPGDRIGYRQPECLGRGLRRRFGYAARRRGHELRTDAHRPRANQVRLGERTVAARDPDDRRGELPRGHEETSWTSIRREAPWNKPRPKFPSWRSASGNPSFSCASCWECRRKTWRRGLARGLSPPRRPRWRSASRPTCCAAVPMFAAPNVWRPPSAHGSASPRPIIIPLSRSTAPSDILRRSSAISSARRPSTGSVGPSFQWNLLNYGRILNNVRLQDAKFQELVATYQQTVLNADQEVENGLVTFLKAHRRTKLQTASVDDAEKAVVIVLAQYKAGAIDFTRVSQLEQSSGAAAGRVDAGPRRNRYGLDSGLQGPWRRLADPNQRL